MYNYQHGVGTGVPFDGSAPDPGTLLHVLQAFRSCADVPALASVVATTAVELTGFAFALLVQGRPGAWAVASSAGTAADIRGFMATGGQILAQQLAQDSQLVLDSVTAATLLGALLPVPCPEHVLLYALRGSTDSLPRGALVCGCEDQRELTPPRLHTLALIAEATGGELERLQYQDELVAVAAVLRRQERMLNALDAIGDVARAGGRRARRALRLALERMLAVLDMIDGGIYLYDYQMRDLVLSVTHLSDGIVAQQCARLSLDEHATSIPVRAATLRRPVLTVVGGRESAVDEVPLTHHSLRGSSLILTLPLLVESRLIGVIQFVGALGRDISEEDQAILRMLVERLSASIEHAHQFGVACLEQERLRALVDASNDAILLLDSQGRAIMINRRAKYFFGLAERDVIGRSAAQLRAMFHLIFEDGASFDTWLLPLLSATDKRAVIEFKVLRAEPRLVQCFTAPVLDQQECLLGRLLVFRDITREREVDRMKNEFVSMVSHELRTPLTSIRGALQLVVGRAQTPALSPRTHELLTISLNNSERLIRLVNDILDISKIEHGALQLRRASLEPGELCRTAVQEVATFAAGRGIMLEVEIDDAAQPISADRDRALQVLTNLLSNAIKFSEPGQRVEVAAVSGEGCVRFSVRDYGRGIAPEDHLRIFEKFQQTDSSLTRDVGGTGLGLAICKALVEEHGGRIWLDSDLGRGATFTFTIPLVSYTDVPASPQREAERPTVLVVDDNPIMRDVVRDILEDEGYGVVEASSGAEALQLARHLQPMLMTLDVMMPGLDGFDVVQAMRRDAVLRNLPVLCISASSDHALGLALDDIDFLLKPFTSAELIEHVRRLIAPPLRRVLVVDDDDHVRPTLARQLERAGLHVSDAPNGWIALDIVQREPPDLILIDVRMPGMDGYEVLRWLKRAPAYRHIPVVILTAVDLDDGARRRAIELGAALYLEKPIASEELLAEISQVLHLTDGRRLSS